MKITKKIVAVFFAATVMATGLFAQSNACKEHLEKGKKYEDEKRWVHALGEYYDAIAADIPTAEALEAYEKWDSLTTAIQAGQPGYGEFDEFSFVDNWLDLLKDYEKYWTENCPYVFYFEKPQRTELNRETKTANYEITITLYDNPKFWEMEKTVEAGLKKAYKEEWNIEYLQNWPKVSVYADKKYDGKYLIDGTAVVSKPLAREPGTTFSDNKVDGEEPYFASSSLVKKLGKVNYFNKDIEWPIRQTAFSASISTWRYRGETYAYGKYCDFEKADKKNSLFDIKFHIVDKNGKTVLQSGRCNVSLNRTIYEFKNVPQETMKLIEDESIDFVIDELCLAYGKIPSLAIEGNRDWIKPLPELKIANYITDSWKTQKNRESVINQVAEIQKNKSFRNNKISKFQAEMDKDIDTIFNAQSFKVSKYIVKKHDGIKGEYSDYLKELRQKSYKNIELAYNYLICNKISEKEGLQPAYKLQNDTGKEYETELLRFVENFTAIICDTKASGYRLPSEKEQAQVHKAAPYGTMYDFTPSDASGLFFLRNK